MKMLRWPNVSLPLGPPPSDRKLVPLMDCWLSLSLTLALHDRVNSFHSCLSLHSRPSQHPLPDSQPNGGTRPNRFQKKSEWGQGLRGAIILPYFRIYFPQSSHLFFSLPSFLEEMERKERFHCLLIQFKRDKPARRYMNHFLLFTSMSHILNINLPNWLGCTRI